MDKKQFDHICDEAQEGREDIFVNHPSTNEGGMVLNCEKEHLIVQTSQGEKRRWDFRDCEETLSRREQFPYR